MKRFWIFVVAALMACGVSEDRSGRIERALGADCGAQAELGVDGWQVTPSAGDDTATLQCVLDAVTAAGSGSILLGAGTFHTAQLVATGFEGTVRGSGASATVITNLDDPLPVTMPYLEAYPTPEDPAAVLVTFVNSNVTVSDLAVVLRGETPVQAWTVFGLDPLHVFNAAIMVLGETSTAVFERLRIEGEASPELFGLNTINGVYFQGFVPMSDPQPLSGRFEVRDSVVRGVASAAPVFNLRDADVVISGNVFEGVLFGAELAAVEGGSYHFAGNQVSAGWYGVTGYDLCLSESQANCATRATRLLFAGNTIDSGAVGVSLVGTLDADTQCLIAGNRVQVPEEGGLAFELGESAQARCVVRPSP